MHTDDGRLRQFLRLLYATFERQRDLFGTYPNFYWAQHFVTTLLSMNMFTFLIFGAKGAHLKLPSRDSVGAWLGIVAVMVMMGLWLTRGLEDASATTALRDAMDKESPHDGLVRRLMVGAYVVVSFGLFVFSVFAT